MENLINMQCKSCGNNQHSLFIVTDSDFICKCCGSWYRFNESQDVHCKIGYDHLITYQFKHAKEVFNNILTETPNNIGALWGWLLSEYQIVYIKDKNSGIINPIYCFDKEEMLRTRLFKENPNFKKILELLKNNTVLREIYIEKSEKIDAAIKSFRECKYDYDNDVFICVNIPSKSQRGLDESNLVKDLKIAKKLYSKLKHRRKKVFFSYYTLKNQVDDAFIWANIVKSKKMVVISSSKDYLENLQIKSEWKRWLLFNGTDNLYALTLPNENQTPHDILPTEFGSNNIYTKKITYNLLNDLCDRNDRITPLIVGIVGIIAALAIVVNSIGNLIPPGISTQITSQNVSGIIQSNTAQSSITHPNDYENVPVTKIQLDKTELTMAPGSSVQITATIVPSNATNQNIIWHSSDTSIASVSDGLITANSNGTTTITATTADGGLVDQCVVVVSEKTIVRYKWYSGALRHKVIYSDGTYDMADCAPTNCVCGRIYN